MKNLRHLLAHSPGRAAVFVAWGIVALSAAAAPQPTPAPAASAVPTATGEDIRDIRGPIHIPAAFPWAAWTAGSLAAVGLGFGTWALLRRSRRALPYELALASLEKLRPLMRPESGHAFSLAVSRIVRRFIEESLPVRAAHRTTHEFLRDLLNLPESVLSEHRGAFEDFLTHCDLAKFARWSLTATEMEAMHACARTFVISIGKPKPARTQPAAAQAVGLVTANS